jgi:hypothetical protein
LVAKADACWVALGAMSDWHGTISGLTQPTRRGQSYYRTGDRPTPTTANRESVAIAFTERGDRGVKMIDGDQLSLGCGAILQSINIT